MTRALVFCTAALLTITCVHAQLYPPMGETMGTLVRDGQPAGALVVPATATDHERAAAEELRAYLARISGAELPVIVEGEAVAGYAAFVGRTQFARERGLIERAAELGDEGLLMVADEDGLALLGGSDLGTRYAVSAFLEEKLGVRWFNPDPLGEVVPKMATIEVGRMDEAQVPDFAMRWIGRGEWALRSRQNVALPDANQGLKILGSAHTFRRFLPPEERHPEHPEWYALVGGARTLFEGVHRNQLCTSNPEVIEATVAAMGAALDADPGLDIISLFPNDGGGFCECDRCRALDEATQYTVEENNRAWGSLGPEKGRTLSRRMTVFYDECARRLAQTHPDAIVKTGIYAGYVLEPLDRTLTVPANCLGQMCHSWCHNHAIADPNCAVNRDFLRAMDGWGRIYPSLCLYEYYYKVAALQLPFPIVHAMRQDIPWLRDRGLFGIYTQYGENWWTIGLNYYLAARLLWDADLDVDALLADYYAQMYGTAEAPMREYHEAYEQAAIDADVHLSAEYAELPLIFTPELLAAQRARLDRARALADSAEVRGRIATAEVVLRYVELCMAYMDEVLARARPLAQARWQTTGEPSPELDAAATAVRAYLDAHAQDHAFRDGRDNYLARFLNPANAVADCVAFLSTGAAPLTKPQWLAARDEEPTPGPAPERFAIWLYANDIDGEDGKPEHELQLRGPEGEYETVAALTDEAARAGNRANRAYVIAGLQSARFLRDGALDLRLVNLPGDWFASTVYAFYVMPELPGATDELATRVVESDLEWVRGASAGFQEYDFGGEPSDDGVPLDATIEVGAFPAVTLPQ